MIGATILAAEACLRVGVGSVKIICTKETISILSRKFPSTLKIEINNLSFLKTFLRKEELRADEKAALFLMAEAFVSCAL